MALLDDIININLNELTDLEKARLLYIELGKKVKFSTKFQNTDDKSFALMYNSKVDINSFNEDEVNCRIWSQLYSQLLSRVGIENRIVNEGHEYVELFIDGKKIVADATSGSYTDLSRIHNGDNTEYFGLSLFQNSDKSSCIPKFDEKFIFQLESIDKKIGYKNEKYTKLSELKSLLLDIKNGKFDINKVVPGNASILEKKLQFLFAKLGTLDQGFYEAKDFVYSLEKFILTSEELELVNARELKKTNRDKSVDVLEVITIKKEDNYGYYILKSGMPIKEVNGEDIIKLSYLGYGKEKNIPGIDYPTNFVVGKVPKGISYVISKMKEKKVLKESNIGEIIEIKKH